MALRKHKRKNSNHGQGLKRMIACFYRLLLILGLAFMNNNINRWLGY